MNRFDRALFAGAEVPALRNRSQVCVARRSSSPTYVARGLQPPRAGWCRAFGFLLLALLGLASPALAAERYAIVVSGASGGEKYAVQQTKWRTDLVSALKTTLAFPEANVLVFSEQSADSLKSTAENLRRVFGDLRQRVTSDDALLIVLLGHGTYDGADAKFNLVGPDLTAVEWKGLLAEIPGRIVLVDTTASSFPFLEELSQKGRVVITATDSAAQRFATVFPEFFVRAMSDLSNDFDKNGRLSIWEVFTAASGGVKLYYEQRGQLSTERPLLDDDGDRVGREALAPGMDGALARSLQLDADPGTVSADVAIAALERQRAALEAQLEDLKGRRSTLSDAEYQAELERILVQLSRIAQQIRQRS